MKCKLIRVTDGVYRNESGGTHVFRQDWKKENPWCVRFLNWYGARVELRFPTLKTARNYLSTN